MGTKIFRNIFALALILFTAIGCSKFEDGPKISFRPVLNRIYGLYRIEYISKNGVDLTSTWNQYYDITFWFYYDENGVYPDIYGKVVEGYIDSAGYDKPFTATGGHISIEIEDSVIIGMANSIWDSTEYPDREFYPIITYHGGHYPSIDYFVTRLTNDEMWLRHTCGDDEYEIHLKENI